MLFALLVIGCDDGGVGLSGLSSSSSTVCFFCGGLFLFLSTLVATLVGVVGLLLGD